MSTQEVVDRIATTWVEGRLENVLERQKQLAALHRSLRQRSEDFTLALEQDLKRPYSFAVAELSTTLDTINILYGQLDFQDVLARERKIKNGADTESFLVPLGVTLVIQSSLSPIISALGPVAAALAAGSPTIVLGSRALPNTSVLLENVIVEALDREAFHFEQSADETTKKMFAKNKYGTVVLHSFEASDTIRPLVHTANPSVRVLEPYYGIPAGVIDRSAAGTVDAAVECILETVRDGSYGNCYRVPRLFLVDESIISLVKDKLRTKHEETSNNLDEWLQEHYHGLSPRFSETEVQGQQTSASPIMGTFTVLRLSNDAQIALVSSRSLDHTIDILNKINAGTGSQVVYIFAGGKEAFYLGNFITTSNVYVNVIPKHSLVLTSCRSANNATALAYHSEDFSEAKLMLRLSANGSQNQAYAPAELNARRIQQHPGGRMSYFEQGLILGAAIGIAAISAIGYLSYRGIKIYISR